MSTTTRAANLRAALQRYWSQYKALHERRRLLERPWLEDALHWSADGELHGQLALPGGGPGSVSSDGWCPGQR